MTIQGITNTTNQQEKERFLVFTRLLMKHLEQTDPEMHVAAKRVLGDRGHRSCDAAATTAAVTSVTSVPEHTKRGLRDLVGEYTWSRVTEAVAVFCHEQPRPRKTEDVGFETKLASEIPTWSLIYPSPHQSEKKLWNLVQLQEQKFHQHFQRQRQRDLQARRRRFINTKAACIYYS
mmetsp:Transcript_12487/g.26321  ORF Transcript_12487/g.26321 Transcript_12487/m.26321 type:complete len:176 (-) Transcript_12487:143-670(-)